MTKWDLRECRRTKYEVERLETMIAEAYDMRLNQGGSASTKSSRKSDPTFELTARIEKYCRSLTETKNRLIAQRQEAMNIIETMYGSHRDVLRVYYINCLPTWEIVAEKLNIGLRQVLRIHGIALLRFTHPERYEQIISQKRLGEKRRTAGKKGLKKGGKNTERCKI